MKVVSYAQGELLSIIGLYGRISQGLKGVVYPVADFDLCYDLSFMDVDKILPSSSSLGLFNLKVKGEVQTKKGLFMVDTYLATRKDIVSNKTLWGVESKRRSRDSQYRSTFQTDVESIGKQETT
ncbi:chloroplast protein [Spatholobus suberectus]|nr:chloroplast protein [Spatholobus suberectus]